MAILLIEVPFKVAGGWDALYCINGSRGCRARNKRNASDRCANYTGTKKKRKRKQKRRAYSRSRTRLV